VLSQPIRHALEFDHWAWGIMVIFQSWMQKHSRNAESSCISVDEIEKAQLTRGGGDKVGADLKQEFRGQYG